MIGGPWTWSMIGVHGLSPYFDGPGSWTRSTEGVHGPGVHVLYFLEIMLATMHTRNKKTPNNDFQLARDFSIFSETLKALGYR